LGWVRTGVTAVTRVGAGFTVLGAGVGRAVTVGRGLTMVGCAGGRAVAVATGLVVVETAGAVKGPADATTRGSSGTTGTVGFGAAAKLGANPQMTLRWRFTRGTQFTLPAKPARTKTQP